MSGVLLGKMLTSPLFNGPEKKKLYSKILRTHIFLETLVLKWSVKSNTENGSEINGLPGDNENIKSRRINVQNQR